MRKLSVLLGVFFLGACSQPIPVVSLPNAIETVEKQLAASAFNASADPYLWSADQETKFINTIKSYQCLSKDADPIVPYMEDSTTLSLVGTYTQNLGFSVSASSWNAASITSSGSAVKGNTLKVTIDYTPVNMLPSKVYQQQKARIVGLETQPHLDNLGSKTTEGEHLLQSYAILQSIVNTAIASYNPMQCIVAQMNNDQFYMGNTKK